MHEPALPKVGVLRDDEVVLPPEKAYLAKILEVHQLRAEAVVGVVVVVRDLVGEVRNLCFEAGLRPMG